MRRTRTPTTQRNSATQAAGSPVRPCQRRTRCARAQAAASPDIGFIDETAEARRRLARQFRRNKVAQPTPQQLVHTQQPVTQQQQPSLNMARLRAQGLRPKPTLVHQQQQQQQQQLDGVQEWYAYCAASQQELALPPEAFAPAGTDAVAAAAARDLLEWQFQLQQDGGGGSSGGATSSSSSSGSVLAAQEAAAALGASQLLQGLSSSPGDAGRQLTSAIMRAQHWRQVQSLIQEHAPSCVNVLHLCAALTRLAHVQYSFVGGGAGSIGSSSVNPHAAAFVQQLFDGIGTRLAELEYRQTCNVVWAAAALQHVVAPEPAWMASLYRQAAAIFSSEKLTQHEQAEALPERQQQAAQLQQQVNDLCHAAQLSYALAKLQDRLPQAQVARYVGWIVDNTRNILQQHIQQHQPAAAPHGSSSSSSSSSSAQQQRQQRPVKHQHQLRARDMATLAWSLSKLCAEPSPAWLSALAAALGCRGLVSAGNYRDLSQLLWSLATFSRHAAEGSAAANSIHAAASAVLGVAQDTHLASCDGQALSNTLWALATLGQRPPLPYLNRLLTHAAAAASRGFLNPQGISNTLWGLAALGVVPQASCMAALQAAAQQQLPHMTPQGLSNTLWALAVLERPPSKGWLAAFWPACRSALPHMTSQAVVNCLWALARLGLQPPQEWLGDVAALLLRGLGLSSLSSQGVANILWAMSRVSICCTGGHALLMGSLQQAVAMLQQQLAQQELPGGQAAAFNTCELSALANAACYLQQRQQAEASVLVHGDSSGSSSSHGAYAASAALVLQLAHLTQTASRMLLPKASPSELAILLRSQVVLPSRGHAHQQPHHQQAQQPAAPVPSAWVDAWLDASNGAFSAASSRDLATWVWCLAVRGQRPSTEWLASWQVATFRQLPRASSQDLSNSLWALASLGVAPEAAWLQRHLAEVSRRQLQKQLLPQHYANLAHALAKLGHRPDRDWLERFQADVVALVPQFKPQELTCALWALAQLNAKADEALLSHAMASMSAQLASYKVNEIAVALWALSRLQAEPSLRLLGAALQHCFSEARQLTPTGWSMLLWSVGSLPTPPPKAWLAKLLVATQVRMGGFSARELSMLIVSLARLEYKPSSAWLDAFAAAAAAKMGSFQAQALANVLWALAKLHYTPSEAWMAAFDAQLSRHIASFTPAHVAMTMWALSSLQWLPADAVWRQLQERAEVHSASFCLRSQRMLARAVRVLQQVEDDSDDEDDGGASVPQRQQWQPARWHGR